MLGGEPPAWLDAPFVASTAVPPADSQIVGFTSWQGGLKPDGYAGIVSV
jgi:hypothetical protein